MVIIQYGFTHSHSITVFTTVIMSEYNDTSKLAALDHVTMCSLIINAIPVETQEKARPVC